MKKNLLNYFGYLVCYLLVFLPYIKGIGNYWDWDFPYFKSAWLYQSVADLSAWRNLDLGSPQAYQSWYLLKPLIYFPIRFLNLSPEVCLYLLLAVIFSVGSFGVWLIVRKKSNFLLSFLIGLAAFLNPAIYYKLLAGHIIYLVSYAIFVYLIYFALNKFKKDLRSYLILSLLFVAAGFQIQFFVFATIFLIIFFLCKKELFSFKYLVVLLTSLFLISLPWLLNFLFGANSFLGIASNAASVQFSGSSHASLARVLAFVFSSATNIQYVYSKWAFAYFGILTFSVIAALAFLLYRRIASKLKNNDSNLLITGITLVVFVLLGTGLFHYWQIPLLHYFYPMFRESGHFAPIVVLFFILVTASLLKFFDKKIVSFAFLIYLVGFVAINVYYIEKYLPKVDFASAREQFASFENFNAKDKSVHRVLSYPFWNQYQIKSQPDIEKNGKLLNNSGWDLFLSKSSTESISNYQPGGASIGDTLQYNLLKNYDLTGLRQRNVKYIYDFSGIYESNFDKYTSPETYFNNLALIKNDPSFTQKVLSSSSDTESVDPHVIKIKDYLPRIYSADASFWKINQSKYIVKIKGQKNKDDLVFLENYNKFWKIYPLKKDEINLTCEPKETFDSVGTTECQTNERIFDFSDLKFLFRQPILDQSHTKEFGYANKWSLSVGSFIQPLDAKPNEYLTYADDGTPEIALAIYFQPQLLQYFATIVSVLVVIVIVAFAIIPKRKEK